MVISSSNMFIVASACGVFFLSWFLPAKFPNLPDWFLTGGIIIGLILLLIGPIPWLLQWLWKPKIYPEADQAASTLTLQPHPHIRQNILALIHELELASGKQYKDECFPFLKPDEALGEETRLPLYNLVHGKVTIVKPLRELIAAFYAVEGVLTYNQQVPEGYWSVYEQYVSLTSQRWVLAVRKYKKGLDENPKTDFMRCAYGLVDVSQRQLNDFKKALDDAEEKIKATPIPIQPNIAGALDEKIKKVAPIHGVSIEDKDDKSTWRIDFKDEATEKQKVKAVKIMDKYHADKMK